ncbi:MAG: CHAT domain-containing protein [Acidobacteria bacterium]|nr:CHAT domain-containing protein [Acidobacteriota bacterium]
MLIILSLCFALPVFPQKNNSGARAEDLFREGKALADKDDSPLLEKALQNFQAAIRLYRVSGNKDGEGRSELESGLIFQKFGKLADALRSYDQALTLFEKTDNKLYQAKTVNFQGVVYSLLGDKKSALGLYNYALRMFKEIDAFGDAIPTINNVGSMYQEAGDTDTALFYFQLALPYVKEIGDRGREGMILLNIGDVYSDAGDNGKAIEYFRNSIPLHQSAKNQTGEIRALNGMAIAHLRANQPKEAVPFLSKALTLNRSRFGNDEALSFNYSMYAWKLLNNKRLAAFYGKQAVNKYQRIRKGIRSLNAQTRKTYLKSIENTYRVLADLLIEQGNFLEAQQVLQMLKEEEFSDFVIRDADEIKDLKQRVALTDRELALLARYESLARSITEIGNEFEKLEITKRDLSRENKSLPTDSQSRYQILAKQLADANAAFELFLNKQLAGELGEKVTREIGYDRGLQSKLRAFGNGTVALYTVVSNDRYRVILTTPTVQVDGKTEITSDALNKKIFAYRDALQDLEVDPRPLGKELYDILIKPIEKDLRASGAKTLLWSLDGTLRYIPFSTLSPDGESYLIEKYQNVIITPKTRDGISSENADWKALGLGVSEALSVSDPGNIGEQISFAPLPGSERELKAIVKDELDLSDIGILPGRRFLNQDFTLKSFADSLIARDAAGKPKFNVVHIASHFRLGNNWNDSFLLLGDGTALTLEGISNRPEIDFGSVELVTLSACDTAFSRDTNGKEVDSLADAIQAKSGKAVLATLWAVADESTSFLMSEFYRNREFGEHATKAESMQKTQLGMIHGDIKPDARYSARLTRYFDERKKKDFVYDKERPFAHPYFWSPFVLIGNWR